MLSGLYCDHERGGVPAPKLHLHQVLAELRNRGLKLQLLRGQVDGAVLRQLLGDVLRRHLVARPLLARLDSLSGRRPCMQ